MAHPQHYPPQAFSPPMHTPTSSGAPSPAGNYFPPAKRQRISPNPQSPYNSPAFGTLQLPNFAPSMNGTAVNGIHTPMAPPPTGAGSMAPPARPAEKAVDVTEIADILTGAGVDLKEEEARLNQTYSNPLIPSSQQLGSSFNSQLSSTGTLSAGSSFNDAFQYRVPGSEATFFGAGPFNQPPAPYKTKEEQEAEVLALAQRYHAERKQYALSDPFLAEETVFKKVRDKGYSNHVSINDQGKMSVSEEFQAKDLAPPVTLQGPDGSTMVIRSVPYVRAHDNALADILSLLTLACQDRVRGVVEQSYTLSKQRRLHTHGVVPEEWLDLAVANGAESTVAAPQTTTGDGETAGSPSTTHPLKRSFSASEIPSTSGSRAPVTVMDPVSAAFQKTWEREQEMEEEYRIKRAKRAADVLAGDGSQTPSGSTPGGPGTPGLVAPDSDRKTTKKELRKAAEAKATEAQQHAHANETARMALGGRRKNYTWMTAGSGASTPNKIGAPSRINTTVNTGSPATSGGVSASAGGGGGPRSRKRFGEVREDTDAGKGIDLRDVLLVLETDRKAALVVEKAHLRMGVKSGQDGKD